ncbi:type II secretion system F family protein [Vibrio cincinnatiensis]|uniref:type II secretion system F family protein n=1 Tax=Vibrio cincinnatiensis TaxID=675 RepID=UPI001EDEE71D|nr:type II secretion system F family protein [Vibrio cincinnatiensis]MCG3733111.1 pilus assembly protein TadB [Vibrio cincinnatiensis]MCG3739901.1 pilus assembly protein TadB [Vibrio cincinnatiensis]
MIAKLALLSGLILLFIVILTKWRRSRSLKEFITSDFSGVTTQQLLDFDTLTLQTWHDKIIQHWRNFERRLGNKPFFKIAAVLSVLIIFGYELNERFIHSSSLVVIFLTVFIGIINFYFWLEKRERDAFEEMFPDALNILTGAISSGESILRAINFVGENLTGEIGKEFSLIGKRLNFGEDPDDVFRKSCHRFPYPSFYFFIISLRANMQRGGQLKEIMTRLNRMLFNARSVDKKIYTLTAEARMSAKIVAAIPFIFLFMLQYLSPENYEFVMSHPSGRPILFYVIISELIGIGIIWLLMKSVR